MLRIKEQETCLTLQEHDDDDDDDCNFNVLLLLVAWVSDEQSMYLPLGK